MTHEELLNEIYEVCAFLMRKNEYIRTKYGHFPNFENEDDSWAFRILQETCNNLQLFKEFDNISGYRKTVSEFEYRTGDGVRNAMETGTYTTSLRDRIAATHRQKREAEKRQHNQEIKLITGAISLCATLITILIVSSFYI